MSLAPDQTTSRERLAGLLWSDRGEEQARASLRQCLVDLRGALVAAGLDVLQVGRETIGLRQGAIAVDVADLQMALRGQDWNAFLALLRDIGDARLLDDLEIGGLHQDWLAQTRARLDQSITAGVHACLEQREALHDWGMVRAMAEAYLHRDPLDETVVAAAIRTDAAIGATSVAHRRFQVLQSALAREFGVAPGAAARSALATVGQEPPAPPAAPVTVADGPPLVIVATFEATTGGATDPILAATLREEVVSGLSRFRDLRVITDPRPLDMIGAELSADRADAYVLGASLRASAADARLTAQLVRVGDRNVIWSDRLAISNSEVVGAIDDIIAKVVGAVLPTINADLLRRASNLPADQTYQRYLLAREAAFSARTFPAAQAAAAELEEMVASFPTFALPYLPLAYLYNTDFGCTRAGSSGPEQRTRALDLAKRAMAVDRGHANGYTATGWSYLRRRQWEPARLLFEQALALNPFHATRVMEVGWGLMFLGEFERSRQLLDRCLLLNPAPEDGFFQDLGTLALVQGDHDRAAGYYELIAEPDLWGVVYMAMNARMGGAPHRDAAVKAHARIARIWPEHQPLDVDNIVEWIAEHHPFLLKDVEDRFLLGAHQTFSGIGD